MSSFKNDIFHNNYSVYVENFQEGALSTDLNNILVKYDNINSEINTYNERKAMAMDVKKSKSDFDSDKLDYMNPTKTIYDGAQEDVQLMLVHQYNMYMAGLIATATIIVFAILLARE